jgi:hypothetical protein
MSEKKQKKKIDLIELAQIKAMGKRIPKLEKKEKNEDIKKNNNGE